MEQIHAERQHRREEETVEVETDIPVVETTVDKSETDRILDEIDALLEPNAVEFVARYQQRGGE